MEQAPDAFGTRFARRVENGMAERGVGLRELCRGVGLDPSFFSKVLSGKRSPPGEEAVLRRIASFLGLDPVGLIVAAGRIPSEWTTLADDPEVLRSAHALVTGGSRGLSARPGAAGLGRRPSPHAPRSLDTRKGGLSDELL